MRLANRTVDLIALLVVLAAAAAVRVAFLSVEPPAFLTTDSLTYALPAIHLAHGEGFDLSLRRTPGYPLFLAAVWALFGDETRPVVYLQHFLGVATAGLTWLLGRVAFGHLPGLLGGLAVALSGPQLVFEHYLMTEALFTLLLVLAILILLVGLRRDAGRLYLLAGVLFGLCAWTRPIAPSRHPGHPPGRPRLRPRHPALDAAESPGRRGADRQQRAGQDALRPDHAA